MNSHVREGILNHIKNILRQIHQGQPEKIDLN